MDLTDEGKFINYRESGSEHYLPVREVNTVFRDKNGLMWIGTKGAGVFHVNTRTRPFEVFIRVATGNLLRILSLPCMWKKAELPG